MQLHSHFHFDRLVRIVANYFEIRELKAINIRLFWVDFEFRKGSRISLQLFFQGIHMIQVNVSVPDGVNEITRLASRHLSHHTCQKRIRRNVEWNAET